MAALPALLLPDVNVLVAASEHVRSFRDAERQDNARFGTRHRLDYMEILAVSKDPRLEDLALALEEGRVVTSERIRAIAVDVLLNPSEGSRPAWDSRIAMKAIHGSMTRGALTIPDGASILTLRDIQRRIREHAPELLAPMDDGFRPLPAGRLHMRGVDGEDLRILAVAERAEAEHGNVQLATGDRALAHAAAVAGSTAQSRWYAAGPGTAFKAVDLHREEVIARFEQAREQVRQVKGVPPASRAGSRGPGR